MQRIDLPLRIQELLTKQVPYSYLKRDAQVMFVILQGIPPACPEDYFTWPEYRQKLWSICIVSWNWDPSRRKSMHEAIIYLQFLCRRSDEERFQTPCCPPLELGLAGCEISVSRVKFMICSMSDNELSFNPG